MIGCNNWFWKAKKLRIFFCVGIITITSFGCSKKQDKDAANMKDEKPTVATVEEDHDDPTPTAAPVSVTEAPSNVDNNTKEEVVVSNNGGLYVGYGDKVYYREYTKDSYESKGIFGNYEDIPDAKKNMVIKNKDGSVEVAFTDTGFGDIYISNNRMYLNQYSEEYRWVIYSVGLGGEDRKDIGNGSVKGIDNQGQNLVCEMSGEGNTYQLVKIDGVTGQVTPYELENKFSSFVTMKDDVIYYLAEVPYEESQLGKLKLCRVNVDGTKEVLLYESEPDLYEYGDMGTEIPCYQFVEDKLYFAYGGYGGTGHFYQGGRIAWVMLDGSQYQVIAGQAKDAESESYDSYENLVDETFYVVKEQGSEILHFSQGYEKKYALTVATGDIVDHDFPIFQEGIPFEYQDGIYLYENTSSVMTTWIPQKNYSYLGQDQKSADLLTMNDYELIGNWVYYRLESSKAAPDASIGWRDGYERMRTVVVRQYLRGGNVEVLYEY